MLRDHLLSLGFAYGDFPAHAALWEMAERTRDDVLARIALVPRTLEARGLDASPAVKAKLLGAGDTAGAAIIDRILHDEIGHVAIGNRWFRWLCESAGSIRLRPMPSWPRAMPRRACADRSTSRRAALPASRRSSWPASVESARRALAPRRFLRRESPFLLLVGPGGCR